MGKKCINKIKLESWSSGGEGKSGIKRFLLMALQGFRGVEFNFPFCMNFILCLLKNSNLISLCAH